MLVAWSDPGQQPVDISASGPCVRISTGSASSVAERRHWFFAFGRTRILAWSSLGDRKRCLRSKLSQPGQQEGWSTDGRAAPIGALGSYCGGLSRIKAVQASPRSCGAVYIPPLCPYNIYVLWVPLRIRSLAALRANLGLSFLPAPSARHPRRGDVFSDPNVKPGSVPGCWFCFRWAEMRVALLRSAAPLSHPPVCGPITKADSQSLFCCQVQQRQG